MAGPASPTAQLWPELYGFWIHGNGPTYVIYVEPTSISETAGIRVGDRIIELDNQDVSNLSAGVIKFMARNSKHTPPPISVQSHALEVEVAPADYNANKGAWPNSYGLTIAGDMPVIVDKCAENSPAYLAGLRPGDILVECNSKPLKYSESLRPLLFSGTANRMLLKYIPVSREASSHGSRMTTQMPTPAYGKSVSYEPQFTSGRNEPAEDMKFKRAQNFYSLVRPRFQVRHRLLSFLFIFFFRFFFSSIRCSTVNRKNASSSSTSSSHTRRRATFTSWPTTSTPSSRLASNVSC